LNEQIGRDATEPNFEIENDIDPEDTQIISDDEISEPKTTAKG
jgi:hypothetical protein